MNDSVTWLIDQIVKALEEIAKESDMIVKELVEQLRIITNEENEEGGV